MEDRVTRRPGVSPLLFVALLILLIVPQASGSPVGGLTTFSNGTIADADDVNANFEAVRTAVDDNDTQIGSLDSRVTSLESRGAGQIIQSGPSLSGSSTYEAYFMFLANKSSALTTQILLPRDGTLTGFSVRPLIQTAPGVPVTVHLHVNGVDVGNPVEFTDADGLSMKTAAGSVSVSAGDLLTFHSSSLPHPMTGVYVAAVTYD